ALPSVLGILGRRLIGAGKIDSTRPHLKLVNSVTLLLLNYGNGAVALPQAVAYPDWDFLAVILGAAVALCVASFSAGWGLGRLFGADRPRRTALMFGLGMNNTGSGRVLSGTGVAAHPRALLPLSVHPLGQHLVAGAAAMLIGRSGAGQGVAQAAAQPGASPALEREATA